MSNQLSPPIRRVLIALRDGGRLTWNTLMNDGARLKRPDVPGLSWVRTPTMQKLIAGGWVNIAQRETSDGISLPIYDYTLNDAGRACLS